ncbi:MAG: ABC-2 transporter permease [Oscillospiraceae bacterium]|nr:ABC-2 transporter permease [Oscillospiraceae bacterium]
MIALIKKDLYLVGKQAWTLLGIALLFCISPKLESFGSTYAIVLAMTLPLTALTYDERCHWDQYMAMTPCPPKKIVLSKYLFALLLIAAALVITLIVPLARSFVTGDTEFDLAEKLVGSGSIMTMVLLVNALMIPTAYRFGVEKGRLTMMLMFFLAFGIIIGGARVMGGDKMFGWMETMPLATLGVCVLAAVLFLNVVSYFLAVRFYLKRRSGAYD